jgi:hypothetical protein
MSDLIFFIFLFILIIIQIIERIIYYIESKSEREKLIDELARAQKAIISKNVNEYMAAIAMDKVDKDKPKIENDNILLSDADDETFDKVIKAANQ